MMNGNVLRPVSEDLRSHKLLAWILLGGFVFTASLAEGVYAAHDAEPSQRFRFLTMLGLMALLWYWFVQEMRSHRPALPMDMGIFLFTLWFILVPYYFWRYERGRGLLKVVGLVGMWVLTWALGALAAFVLA